MTNTLTTIIFLLAYIGSSAQTKSNAVDTFYQKRATFITNYWKDLNIVDTITNSKGNLTVTHKNIKGYIRQQSDNKNDTGCITESLINYIDTNNLVAYCEHWSFDCQSRDPNDYYGLLDTYRRFLYDSQKRKISEFVLNNSTGAWRYDYMYYDKEEQNSKSTKLARNQFWSD